MDINKTKRELMSEVLTAVQAILGPDNNLRKQGEEYLSNCRKNNAGDLIENLFETMKSED
jgi:hypothetical protein